MSAVEEPRAAGAEPYELTDRDRAMLDFEGQWWKFKGAKDEAIRRQFDMSPTRYYQALNALILHNEAIEAEPMIIKRLRRLRTDRQRARARR